MEALGVAANITAVIGIAGQVAQGCVYLYTIFDDVRGAPRDLRCLRLELRVIEQILILTPEQAVDALLLCEQAIQDVRADVEKYGDVDGHGIESGSGGLGMRKKRLGKRLKMAFGKEKIRKHIEALKGAKSHLVDARSLQCHLEDRERWESLIRSIDEQAASSAASTDLITTRIDNTSRTLLESMSNWNAQQSSLNTDWSSFTRTVQSVQNCTSNTENAINTMVARFEEMPSFVSEAVEETVQRLLTQHYPSPYTQDNGSPSNPALLLPPNTLSENIHGQEPHHSYLLAPDEESNLSSRGSQVSQRDSSRFSRQRREGYLGRSCQTPNTWFGKFQIHFWIVKSFTDEPARMRPYVSWSSFARRALILTFKPPRRTLFLIFRFARRTLFLLFKFAYRHLSWVGPLFGSLFMHLLHSTPKMIVILYTGEVPDGKLLLIALTLMAHLPVLILSQLYCLLKSRLDAVKCSPIELPTSNANSPTPFPDLVINSDNDTELGITWNDFLLLYVVFVSTGQFLLSQMILQGYLAIANISNSTASPIPTALPQLDRPI